MSDTANPERWARLEWLFHEAANLAPEEVRAFLDREAANDDAMRREVLDLLAREAADLPDVLAQGAASLTGNDLPIPEQVGSYRIDRELGRGGMGVVYLGVRERGDFEHRVAIKMLLGAAYDPAMMWRFQNERQILARLQHPGIARLLDGGTAESGVPYVVMDFVDGAPIDAYCDENGLGRDERIQLFLKVCEAVSYAHTKLIAHRDIKPSNILIDSHGEPKLLDFGIAKLVDPSTVDGDVTATRIMTLSFASPEQLAGEPVGTGADVYALGALLYLLLTGHRPHGKEGVSSTELARRILQDVPQLPSAVSGHPELRGDLDTIVGKALERDVAKRYGSVDALAQDLDAHRRSLPISARPPTFGYRASRLLQRNRVATFAAGVAALAILAGGIGLTLGLARAQAAEAVAVEEAQVASEVTDFLVGLFDIVGADSSLGREINAVDLLDRGLDRIDQDLAGQPVIQARLKEAMGTGYKGLAQFQTARRLFNEILAVPGVDDERRAIVQTQLGGIYRFAADIEAANSVLSEAIATLEPQVDTSSREAMNRTPTQSSSLLTAISESGLVAAMEADYPRAEELTSRALRLRERYEGPDARATALTASALSAVFAYQRRIEEAKVYQQQAVEVFRRTLPEDDLTLLQTEGFLAMLYAQEGDVDSAQAILEEILPRQRSRLGDRHIDVVQAVHNLGTMLAGRDEAKSRSYLEEALASYQEIHGPESLATTSTLLNLGMLEERQQNLSEAAAYYGRAAQIRTRFLGEENPRTAFAMLGLANTLRQLGNYAESAPNFRTALNTLRAVDQVPREALRDFSEVLRALGQDDEAVEIEEEFAALSGESEG